MKYQESFFTGEMHSVIVPTEVNFKTSIVQEKYCCKKNDQSKVREKGFRECKKSK